MFICGAACGVDSMACLNASKSFDCEIINAKITGATNEEILVPPLKERARQWVCGMDTFQLAYGPVLRHPPLDGSPFPPK